VSSTRLWVVTSRPVVGSSKTISRGLFAIAVTMPYSTRVVRAVRRVD
jgi:hypothetical protein